LRRKTYRVLVAAARASRKKQQPRAILTRAGSHRHWIALKGPMLLAQQ
jgi:hypothetical protein